MSRSPLSAASEIRQCWAAAETGDQRRPSPPVCTAAVCLAAGEWGVASCGIVVIDGCCRTHPSDVTAAAGHRRKHAAPHRSAVVQPRATPSCLSDGCCAAHTCHPQSGVASCLAHRSESCLCPLRGEGGAETQDKTKQNKTKQKKKRKEKHTHRYRYRSLEMFMCCRRAYARLTAPHCAALHRLLLVFFIIIIFMRFVRGG